MGPAAAAAHNHFYPRPPRGGRHVDGPVSVQLVEFLSTPSARRATDHRTECHQRLCISIHALREEGDRTAMFFPRTANDFYPRPPRGGRRTASPGVANVPNFYPRPPRGGRRDPRVLLQRARTISIHALREEGDPIISELALPADGFLSTPSARRATFQVYAIKDELADFYPRPPRGGRHSTHVTGADNGNHFYPRPPRGGRPVLRQRYSLCEE